MTHLTPAQYVVKVLGGVRNTARAIDVSPATVCRWGLPKKRKKKTGGSGGLIPARAMLKIQKLAQEKNLPITPEDLLNGRDIQETN